MRPSPSPSTRSKIFLSIAAAILAAAPLRALAASDGVNVNMTVFFCNGDLVCDPEENATSCPSDCAGEAEPEPSGGDAQPEPRNHPPTRRQAPATTTPPSPASGETVPPSGGEPPAPPSAIGGAGEGSAGSVSSTRVDSSTASLAITFSVDAPEDTSRVTFSWAALGGAQVRILRSGTADFPSTPYDGGVVAYEGDGTSFRDEVAPGETARYAAFVRQPDGSYGPRLLIVVSKPPVGPAAPAAPAPDSGNGFPPYLWAWILVVAALLYSLFTRLARKSM